MYSAVLMLAMTGAGDLPSHCFGSSCGGYDGCWGGSCSGSCWGGGYGGCWGSCSGGGYGCCGGGHKHSRRNSCCGGGGLFGGGLFSRKNSCHGCCGGYGCHGGYGCCGGYGYCTGCNGGYAACTGGAVCGGPACAGCGGAVVVPAAPGATDGGTLREGAPAGGTKKEEKKGTMGPAPATIIVTLPADARLTIDGETTTSTSSPRVFVSPNLDPEREFQYTLKAEWMADGRNLVVTKKITVTAGRETAVTMQAEAAGVASR
jgi:uncharacterized protein (TIGR03000 family)